MFLEVVRAPQLDVEVSS